MAHTDDARAKGWRRALGMAVSAAIAVVVATWIDFRQTRLGETFALRLVEEHQELRLVNANFDDQHSFLEFRLSEKGNTDSQSEDYVLSLGSRIQALYCEYAHEFSHGLGIELLHVNVRGILDGRSRYILSRSLSEASCRR